MWCCAKPEAEVVTAEDAEPPPKMEEEPPKAEPPKAEPEVVVTWECTLDKKDGELGLHYDYWDHCIQINGIVSGGVEEYNREATEGRKVMKHDFITMVNGETTVDAMKAKLTNESQFTIKFAHPVRHTFNLSRDHASWGVRLRYQTSTTSTCVCILDILPGAVKAFNEAAAADQQLKKGDFIESINGISDTSKEMYEEFAKARKIECVVLKLPLE